MVLRNKIPWYWNKTLFQMGYLGGWIFIVAKLIKYIKINTLASLKFYRGYPFVSLRNRQLVESFAIIWTKIVFC